MRRLSFLPVFLSCLTVAFVVALVIRIRSYSAAPQTGTPATVATTTVAGATIGRTPLTPAPYTVEPAPPATQKTAPASTSRARVREQILREARSAPAAAATTTTTAPAPRVTPPRPATTSTQPPRPAPSPQPVRLRPSASAPAPLQPHPASPNPTTPQPQSPKSVERDKKDPNSDTSPPQLIGIEFVPTQVHDGEEARIVITAVDDLSGIKGISGTITSPTGKALQGFAAQPEADSNRYIGRFVVPKNGEEGLWRVNILTMSDNASNSVTLSQGQGTLPGTAVLQVVSSQSDSTPPVLKSVRAQKRSMRPGEPNPIYIEATDDKSGVNLVSAVFQSPNKKARIGAGCRRGEGDIWECELSLPSCIDCGDWQLEQVTLQDKANNLATFRLDNPIVQAVKVNIGGESCDSEPPRLQGIVLDQSNIVMQREGAVVTVTVTATDDACGVSGVSGQYSGPVAGSGGFFPLQQSGDGNTWVGRIPLDARAPRGLWHITSIQLTDKGHNLRIYYGNDPLLQGAAFQVR